MQLIVILERGENRNWQRKLIINNELYSQKKLPGKKKNIRLIGSFYQTL